MCACVAKSEEVIKIPTGHMPMLADPTMLADRVVSCLKLEQ